MISEKTEQDFQEVKERLTSGEESIEVNLGEMSQGPATTVDLDFVRSVESSQEKYDDLGEVYEVEVHLSIPPWVYSGDKHGNAVYNLMKEYGFDGPDGSPRHGTQLSDNSVTLKNYKVIE